MCLRRAPEKYIAGAALDRAAIHSRWGFLDEGLIRRKASTYAQDNKKTE
jgi:hypothetical protein